MRGILSSLNKADRGAQRMLTLKVIKREMYGRANFDLLRRRVLAHA